RGYIKRPKTAASYRQVPVPPELLALLEQHRQAQVQHKLRMGASYQDHGLVHASQVGTPVNPNNLSRDFLRLIDQAGVPRIAIHGLRHTTATLALEGGE